MLMVVACLLPHVGCGAEIAPAVSADQNDPAEVVRFRPDLSLDRETGQLTYSIINVSDQPVDVHMETLTGMPAAWLQVDTPGGILMLYDIELDAEEFGDLEWTPDGKLNDPYFEHCDKVDIGIRASVVKHGRAFSSRTRQPQGDEKRVVTLRPEEGLCRSLVLQDQPWYDEVVAVLEGSGLTKFRICPRAEVRIVDKDGKEHWDSASARAYSGHLFGDDGSGVVGYPAPGVKFDLEYAKKLQAMKTKAAARGRPSEAAPTGKADD